MNLINKKGFTLVELLAILVILSIIALIAYPIIGNIISNSRNKLEKEQYTRILSSAKNWVTANSVGDEKCLDISELISAGHLEKGKIENPNGGEFNGSFKIKWDVDNNQYTYVYWTSPGCTGVEKAY